MQEHLEKTNMDIATTIPPTRITGMKSNVLLLQITKYTIIVKFLFKNTCRGHGIFPMLKPTYKFLGGLTNVTTPVSQFASVASSHSIRHNGLKPQVQKPCAKIATHICNYCYCGIKLHFVRILQFQL